MNNLMIIGICVLVSFIVTAIFMTCYKEAFKAEYDSDKSFIYSNIREHWGLISSHSDALDILRARVTDLENENKVNEITKEMEKLDDGK